MRALVLEGGGAKGAYQIGAWQLLRERQEHFDLVTGTSVGALNGALVVQGDFDAAYELWHNASLDQIVAGQPELLEKLVNMQINTMDYRQVMRYLKQVVGDKGLDITPLQNLIKRVVDEKRIRNSKVKLGIVTVSLTDFKPLELPIDGIPEGHLHDYLIASSNLPIFKMSHSKGQLYIDGGFYDNLPLHLATRMGATDLTTIELGAIGMKRIPKNLKYRSIAPNEDLGPLLAFSQDRVRRNMKLGYFDAQKSLDGLLGKKFYIKPTIDNDRLAHVLSSLNVDALNHLAAVLGYEGMDPRRFTFEHLLPKLGDLLGVNPNAPYSEMLVALLETISDQNGLDPFSIRDVSMWMPEVRNLYQPGEAMVQMGLLDKLFLQTSVFGQAQRQALLKTVYEKLIYEVNV